MEDQLTKEVIGAAIEVHREVGPGLLESAYQTCLEYLLLKNGMKVLREFIC
jgi:GxxExxY protein